MVLFGPPEKVTAFASSARGQLPAEVDDDFLVHLHYPTSAPLGSDSLGPAPGTRIAGPRVTVGASCLAAHIDAEQPRWRVEGTRGSVSSSILASCEKGCLLLLRWLNSTRSGGQTRKRTSSRQVGRRPVMQMLLVCTMTASQRASEWVD